jgi:hypothetical protein
MPEPADGEAGGLAGWKHVGAVPSYGADCRQPDMLPSIMNKAHALMFLGRDRDARALYAHYKGQDVKNSGNGASKTGKSRKSRHCSPRNRRPPLPARRADEICASPVSYSRTKP